MCSFLIRLRVVARSWEHKPKICLHMKQKFS